MQFFLYTIKQPGLIHYKNTDKRIYDVTDPISAKSISD
ncbi:hypothetical protein BH10BAC5_BH10BAC5_28550 [soil metagenome]